jgi:hypothetical protein
MESSKPAYSYALGETTNRKDNCVIAPPMREQPHQDAYVLYTVRYIPFLISGFDPVEAGY